MEEAGNRGTATSALLTLPDGTYVIGVQAIDGRWQGSPFTTCQFTMQDGTATAVRSISRQLKVPKMDRQGAVIYAIITTIFVFQTLLSVFILVLGGSMATAGASWLASGRSSSFPSS